MTTAAAPPPATPPWDNARALRRYVSAVVVVGGAVVASSAILAVRAPDPLAWLLFATLAILTGSFTIRFASVSASTSVADTFFFTSALLFGPAPATISLAIHALTWSWGKRHSWPRVAFNTVAPAVSLWVAAQAFFLLAGVQPLMHATITAGHLVLPLLALTVIYFVLNSGLTAVAVGLDSRQSPVQVWCRHFFWLSIDYFAAASLAFCVVLLFQQGGFAAVAIIIPVLAVFYLTLQSSFGRLEDAHRHLAKVDRLYLSTVETLAMAIDAKDDVTHSHVRRVQAYSMGLARALEITDEPTLKAIEAAALLHDTGKLAVPEHILNKPGGLTATEFDQMKLHVDVGADILSLVEFPYPVVPIVRCHHENWDGTGYPRGVKGEDIPIGARILSVADCYDALTSDRPYRRRMTDEAALDILRERKGRMYDPRVVDKFIEIYRAVVVVADAPEQRDVLAQIRRSTISETVVPAPASAVGSSPAASAASDDVLAFVSVARLASGDVRLSDVLALSANLIRNIMPAASGAWYVPDAARGELVAVETFGAAGPALRGASMRAGDRLTGWVAANRQVIVNSDAALDLGERGGQIVPALGSCMSVPLLAGDALVAVLSLYAEGRDVFTDDLSRLVQMIAPHMARAIVAAKEAEAAANVVPAVADKAPAASRELRLVVTR
jgi:putative nucleotidyltransferase with HDIG domain